MIIALNQAPKTGTQEAFSKYEWSQFYDFFSIILIFLSNTYG